MTVTPVSALPAEVGGYPVVRLLARGSRATTALVRAADETRVARILSATCADVLIDAELAVHDAVRESGPALRDHAVELDDLVTLADGRLALLLSHVGGPRLDDVLACHPAGLSLGEAVTILAPIAQAVDAAHAAGITGLGLGLADIRFSTAGAPVITRWHDAASGPTLPERFRILESAYGADLAALDRLGRAIAASVGESDRSTLVTALTAVGRGQSLAHALFDHADPVPVRLVGRASLDDAAATVPATSTPPATAAEPGSVTPTPAQGVLDASRLPTFLQSVVDTFRVLGLPSALVATIEDASHRVARVQRGLVDRALRFVAVAPSARSGVRPRFVVAGVAGVAAIVVAVALVAGPAGVASDTAPGGGPVVEENSIDERAPVPDDESASGPETTVHPQPEQWQPIVDVLVTRWMDCREAMEATSGIECASGVVHAGSAAEVLIAADDPRHDVVERWSSVSGDAVVVERMGGAVLIDLVVAGTTTASLLVVRSEAGWRVRDVIG